MSRIDLAPRIAQVQTYVDAAKQQAETAQRKGVQLKEASAFELIQLRNGDLGPTLSSTRYALSELRYALNGLIETLQRLESEVCALESEAAR